MTTGPGTGRGALRTAFTKLPPAPPPLPDDLMDVVVDWDARHRRYNERIAILDARIKVARLGGFAAIGALIGDLLALVLR